MARKTETRPGVNSSGHQDRELVERIAQRDLDALRDLIETHGGVLLGAALRIIRDHGFAEEVCQDTLLTLWQRPEIYDPERGSLRSLLVRIARNKAIDLVRKEEAQRRKAEGSVVALEDLLDDPFDHAVDISIDTKEALEVLSVEQKQAVFLAYFAGLTYRDVARMLGVPEGTIKTRIRDGMARMRLALA